MINISSLLGGSSGGSTVNPRPDYPYNSAANLYDWANNYSSKYSYDPAKPYPGQLSAPMTQTEGMAQNKLQSFVGSDSPAVLTKSANYTSDVLDGKYDPRTSDYYKGMREKIMQEAKNTEGAILHDTARSGHLYSDPRHDQERQLVRDTSMDISTLLGSMYENERNRMDGAASQGVTTASAQQNLPLQQIAAGSQYGAIPRTVEQDSMGRDYNEYLRQLEGAREPLNIYSGLTGRTYDPYDNIPLSSNSNSNGLGSLLSTIMQIMPMFT